jgi:hypothetical protein
LIQTNRRELKGVWFDVLEFSGSALQGLLKDGKPFGAREGYEIWRFTVGMGRR